MAVPPPPPAIALHGVRHVFDTDSGPVEALAGLDVTVANHEFVAVLGPSGCGKSTLLRLVAGLIAPGEGRVAVYGLPIVRPRDDVGIVFQRPTLLPWASVEDNVLFPVRHQTGRVSRADRERARALIATVGLSQFAGRMPSQLSGGMQQRVAIARALLMDPDILLMDEPFSALDALTREEMGLELLRLWQARPKTVVFITHSISEAVLLADRVLVMSARPGRIVEDMAVPVPRPRGVDSSDAQVMHECSAHLRGLLIGRHAA